MRVVASCRQLVHQTGVTSVCRGWLRSISVLDQTDAHEGLAGSGTLA